MLSLNEVHFGAPLPAGMCAVARVKMTPRIFHRVAVEGHRFKSQEALDAQIVDGLATSGEEVVKKAVALAESLAGLSAAGVVGLIKV